jgi:predicted metal-dependent peptidase
MAVIDGSGSMTASVLADISKELAVMSKTHRVLVVEADDKIRDVYPYRPVEAVKGRGGTDFRPALAPDFLNQHSPDLVVYFTDGRGTAPVEQPSVPVIWCLTVGGRHPCAWGRVVNMGCI